MLGTLGDLFESALVSLLRFLASRPSLVKDRVKNGQRKGQNDFLVIQRL